MVVDDHDDFRESASALLEAEGFAVAGAAADGAEAIAAVGGCGRRSCCSTFSTRPDGFAVAERLAVGPDPPSVVLVSDREAAAYGP